jgi:hypothetical protein
MIHSTTRYRLSALIGVPENAWIWYSYICLGSLEKEDKYKQGIRKRTYMNIPL